MTHKEMLEQIRVFGRARREAWSDELYIEKNEARKVERGEPEFIMRGLEGPGSVDPYELDDGYDEIPGDEAATDWVILP